MALTRATRRLHVALATTSAALVALAACPSSAHAQSQESAAARRASAALTQDYTHTLVSVNAGLLSLPAANVCPRSRTSCEKGETSVSLGVYNQYHIGRFGLGASISWARSLLSGTAPGAAELNREHDRSYFLVEGQLRYYGIQSDKWVWWGGATLGAVIIRDAWTVATDREPAADTAFVGPRSATLSTEGLAAGLAIGGEWTVAPNWSLGTTLRYASWFLPTEPVQAPTGDSASLSGRVDMLEFGLLVAYRLAL
ncbi:hypothetical protein [Polyangium jinanense]|uniref:Outer membrane protein beta-barrel domain-containing protein n=1 Tax=Polyangium jinanense TaxID=2829994 RepID=A0A9X3X850_9BACT|nr:hypothetical protein [Polyangium jinanense]MDC3954233.1 hypothetical protein [Polyangium jinanense]MDC3984315.1 hypothetical protein [Polyangium jinanense]